MSRLITESIVADMVKEISEQISEAIAEPGFDNQNPPAAPGVPPTQTPINTQGDTNTTDIAQQAPNAAFVKNSISQSLPFMLGFVQPLNGPVGFVFGNKQREDTSIPDTANTEDQIITRKLVETNIREVKLDFTNETIEDINRLFGNNFPDYFDQFQKSGGEVWNGPNGEIARFFLQLGMHRMTAKINNDFIGWLQEVATDKGSNVMATYAEMANIYGIIGELRESLYKSTHKSGSVWLLVTPKIAAFLSSTVGSTMNNGADVYNIGRTYPTNTRNGYVMTMGDIDIYQYDAKKDVTGGTGPSSETDGELLMGFTGGPGVSSIFYMPYKEYIVQGGDDYSTGQSTVFYRVRDAWCTNPLDTYDKSQLTPELPNYDTTNVRGENKSQYVVKASVTFGQTLLA